MQCELYLLSGCEDTLERIDILVVKLHDRAKVCCCSVRQEATPNGMAIELRPVADVRDACLEEEVEPLLFLSESRLLRRGKGITRKDLCGDWGCRHPVIVASRG